jgi:hypothetical protein
MDKMRVANDWIRKVGCFSEKRGIGTRESLLRRRLTGKTPLLTLLPGE